MPAPAASVIVASRDRPADLARALAALDFQRFADFEVVVAGPPGTLSAADFAPFRDRVTFVPVPEANLAQARNAGARAAAAPILAFLDDDAVPEPAWLGALVAAFSSDDTGAVGGYVRGPDGLGWQWRAEGFDRRGADVALSVPEGGEPVAPSLPAGVFLKTPGTNMAWRRSALAAIGGFCEAFRFFLEETDANLRLAGAGWRVRLAPRAVVVHGVAASPRRDAGRAPRSLHEIGSSKAVFLRRHLPAGEHEAALAVFRAAERRRLLRFMLAGRIEPARVGRLLAGLDAGIAEGRARPIPGRPALDGGEAPAGAGLFPLPRPARGLRLLVLPARFHGAAARDIACIAAQAGAEVTLREAAALWTRPFRRYVSGGYWREALRPLPPPPVLRPGDSPAASPGSSGSADQPAREFNAIVHAGPPLPPLPDGPVCERNHIRSVYFVESLTCVCPEFAVLFG